MKASDYIIKFLADHHVEHIFYMIGGMVTHIVDSSIDNKDIDCITMHHEQGAAFAAEGYARCTGEIGVAMATSGPGATNLITGIGSCFFDSVPCLFITGQVNTYEYKYDSPVRQMGFQETDIVSMVRPITKGARLVQKAEDLCADLEWAVNLAQSGRPGPVLLDIPMDIQRADIDPSGLDSFSAKDEVCRDFSDRQLADILQCLKKAKRPVILVGGGVRSANAHAELYGFVEKTNIPVVASLMGIDAFPHTHSAYAGMIGAYGNRSANFVIANADFLLILGSRLDARQTGTKRSTFARAATIVRVDIDEHELNSSVKAHYSIKAHLKDFLVALNNTIDNQSIKTPQKWLQYVQMSKNKFPVFTVNDTDEIDPNEFIYLLSKQTDDDAIITVDTGQHQMWTAQSFEVKEKQHVLISGGMGAMGFSLPAAIGAVFAEPNKQIVVIVGDGGVQINIQELQTIVRNKLNIKIVVLNNHSLGMVRQFQEIYFNGRTEGTLDGYDCPDFVKLATAYGIHAIKLDTTDKVNEKVKECLMYKGACLLEVMLPSSTVVTPKLIVNHPIEDQDPKLSDEEFESMMLIPICSR